MEENLKLYYFLPSQPSCAVKSLLLLGNVPHTTIEINLAKGD